MGWNLLILVERYLLKKRGKEKSYDSISLEKEREDALVVTNQREKEEGSKQRKACKIRNWASSLLFLFAFHHFLNLSVLSFHPSTTSQFSLIIIIVFSFFFYLSVPSITSKSNYIFIFFTPQPNTTWTNFFINLFSLKLRQRPPQLSAFQLLPFFCYFEVNFPFLCHFFTASIRIVLGEGVLLLTSMLCFHSITSFFFLWSLFCFVQLARVFFLYVSQLA